MVECRGASPRWMERESRAVLLRNGPLWAATCCLCWLALCAATASAWELRIGTRTEIQCDPSQGVRVQGTRVLVDCHLRDNVHQGIAGRNIVITFQRTEDARGFDTVEVQTDRTGRFYATLQLSETGTYEGRITYSGWESYHSPSEHRVGSVEVRRSPVTLELALPRHLMSSDSALAGRVVASSGQSPVEGLPIEIQAAGTSATFVTGEGGSGRFHLPLEAPGAVIQVEASFPGDQRFTRAATTRAVRILRAPTLTLEAQNVRARLQRGVELRGRLADRVSGVGGVGVDLTLTQQEAVIGRFRALTDEEGGYALFVPEKELLPGPLSVQAAARVGDHPLEAPAASLEVEKTGPGPLPWLLGVVVAALALGYAALGLRDWWQDRRRRQPPPRQQRPRHLALEQARHPSILPPPLAEEPPRAAPGADTITGILWDLQTQRPIPGGLVRLAAENQEAPPPQTADARGRVTFAALSPGRYRMEVTALGYVSASWAFSIPHRGELNLFRFPLTPVRVIVRDLFDDLSGEVTRQGNAWGRLTPRELQGIFLRALHGEAEDEPLLTAEGHEVFSRALERALEAQAAQAALSAAQAAAAVTHIIEEVYYSQRLHEEAVAVLMERLAAQIRQHLHGGPR